MGWRAGVAAATAVFVLTLAALPLYVSSSATAAYDAQVASLCAADAGFSINAQVSPHLDTVFFRQLDDSLASEPLLRPGIVTRVTPAVNLVPSLTQGTPYRQVRLVHRPDQQDHLRIVRGAYDPDGVLIPDYFATALGLAPGATLHLLNGQTQVDARLSGTYDTVPTDPTPSYWCGLADLFRPNQVGDPPLPALIAPDQLLTDVMPTKDGFLTTVLERRLVQGSGTVTDAARLAGDVQRTIDDAEPGVPPGPGGVSRYRVHWDLAATVRRAREVSTVVRRNVLPVQVVGVAAGAIVLAATGLLVARRRRKELRVLAVRGMQLPAVGVRVAGAVAPPAIIGAIVGLGAAVVIVRVLGPSARIETSAYRQAALLGVVALVAAIALIAVVTVGAARHALDRPAHHRAWYTRVPWELVLVGLAVIAFFRLDEAGGVRLVGAQADRGDLLGQMFPLLAVAAAIAVLVRLLVVLLRRLHRVGRSLRPANLLGVRRATADAASTAGVIAATAFAIAAWCTAVILTDSTTQALRDKADTFVGADEAIRTNDARPLPPALHGRATIVSRQLARSGEYAVDVLGIDPATFRDGAHVTEHIPARLLDDITRRVAPGEPIPVIVVGRPLDEEVLGSQQRDEKKLPVEVVGRLTSFPGYNNGASLVVMSRDALSGSPLGSYQEVWIRDPQATDAKALIDSGTQVYATSVAGDIFDVTSFLALRWSFDATKAFGVLVGSVIVTVLLLVLDARSRARQATYLLAVRMGLRPRQHLRALLIELGVPLLGGFTLGVLLAIASTRLSVARLDSLRNLQPPARQIVQLSEMSGGLLVVLAVVVALAAWGQAITVRGRPEEVLRATE